MDLSAKVLTAVQDASLLLSVQLLRHGKCDALVKDVHRLMQSATVWLPPSAVTTMRRLLLTPDGSRNFSNREITFPPALKLSGFQLDAALSTLSKLNMLSAALSTMAHEPQSCSSVPGIDIYAQSWLVAHKSLMDRQYWKYGYALTFQNTADEPLQLVHRTWTVHDLSGISRYRESTHLFGLQPIIEPSQRWSGTTGISITGIKGSMKGSFEWRGLDTGSRIKATVPAFALTP